MLPLLGLQGSQANVGGLSRAKLGLELHPEPRDVQILLSVCGAVTDVPQRS